MNFLSVGSDKSQLLHRIKLPCLLIDDGEIIDRLAIPARRNVTVFDTQKHSFNPLKDMDYRRAREFVAVLDAVFPEGENTLTKATFRYQLLEALSDKPRTLDKLIADTKDTQYAYQKIQTLLLSPVLERVLNHPTNMSFKGTIIARLDRALLGDFDAFVLGNLLISQYAGQVVIPDFGFYAIPAHTQLIRQNRLIAGVTSFDQVPSLQSELILIAEKVGSRSTPDDAAILAQYAGFVPHTNEYNDFIARCLTPA